MEQVLISMSRLVIKLIISQLMNQKEEYWKKKFDREQVARRLAEERYRNTVGIFSIAYLVFCCFYQQALRAVLINGWLLALIFLVVGKICPINF